MKSASTRQQLILTAALLGALPAWGSWLWLGGHSVMCFWVASWLTYRALSPRLALPALIGVAAIGTVYLFKTDGGWPALLLMLGSTRVALGQTPRLFRRS